MMRGSDRADGPGGPPEPMMEGVGVWAASVVGVKGLVL